jgi:hypothetical protein
MEIITEEEAFAFDEYYTAKAPKVDHSKARIRVPMLRLDSATAEYIASEALAVNKTSVEITGEIVRERIAASL